MKKETGMLPLEGVKVIEFCNVAAALSAACCSPTWART
jgi:hypothetical protein